MIHYDLRCSDSGHVFDGWFRDSATFEQMAKAGLIECPTCAGRRIERALMAPAVSTRRAALPGPQTEPAPSPPAPAANPAPQVPAPVAGGRLPDAMRALLQRLRVEVERNCDYVGPTFADEARRMHHGEIDHRAIYGEATADEAESLAGEGIPVNRIPWVPLPDS